MKSPHFILPLITAATAFLLSYTSTYAQISDEDAHLDSLRTLLANTDDDAKKAEILNTISRDHYSVDSTMYYATKTIALAQKIGNPQIEATGLSFIAWALYCSSDYVASCEYSERALMIADSINDNKTKSYCLYQLGNAYSMLHDASTSIEYYRMAINLSEEIGDTGRVCDILINIAQENYENRLYDEAREALDRAINLNTIRKNEVGLSEAYYGLGYIEYRKHLDTQNSKPQAHLLELSKKELVKSWDYALNSESNYELLRTGTILSQILVEQINIEKNQSRRKEMLDSCHAFIKNGYEISDHLGIDNERNDVHDVYAKYLTASGQHDKAKAFLDSIFVIFMTDQTNYIADLQNIYLNYSIHYNAINNNKEALRYYKLFHELEEYSRKNDYAAKAARGMAQTNFNQQLREREIRYENETEIQNLITTAILVVLVLVVIITFIVIHDYKKSRMKNLALDDKNNELELQKEEILKQNENLEMQKEQIEQQRHDLMAQNQIISAVNEQTQNSITYASFIQRAALPSEGQMNSLFGSHLVIYKPLNIISGDFYWASQVGKLKMLAVADCTGHGVPGAFLSMLGISILNQVTSSIDPEKVTAGEMLDKMRTTFKLALHQRGNTNDNRDGLDIALLLIDHANMKMQYAGAFRPALVIRDGEIIKLEADRMPIGYYPNELEHFSNKTFDLQKDDAIYLYTDGMTDQFGYDKDRNVHKFTAKRLNKLLTDIYRMPFSTQETRIHMTMDDWRTNIASSTTQYEQTDDALIVGIKM